MDDRAFSLRMVIAYENVAAALRARRVSEWLSAHLESDIELDSTVWEFDALNSPHLREQAAAEALAADLIVISARGDAELPDHVKNWIGRWAPRKRGEAAALVALLQHHPDSSGPLGAYLRQVAEQGRMDFFCKAGNWHQAEPEYAVEIIEGQQEHHVTAPVESFHGELAGRAYSLQPTK